VAGGLLILAVSSALVGGDDSSHNRGSAALVWQDHALRFSSTILVAADWLTTIDGLRQGRPESNPLLGQHPSLGRANVMIATGLLANAFLVPKIKDPRLRRGIWLMMVVIELHAVHNNRSQGLRFNLRL
jgi:hypothetical protein